MKFSVGDNNDTTVILDEILVKNEGYPPLKGILKRPSSPARRRMYGMRNHLS